MWSSQRSYRLWLGSHRQCGEAADRHAVKSRMRASPWLWNFRRLVLLRMPKERISVRLRSLTDSGQLPRGCYHTQGRVC